MKSPIAVVVLAAGASTRMKSAVPKVLHPLAGWPMLRHVLANVAALKPARVVGVVAPGARDVAAAFAPHPTVVQRKPRSTGDAAKAALGAVKGHRGPVLVVYGDAPLVTRVDTAILRDAIHDARKLAIAYIDENGHHTHLTIRPIAMAYYVDVALLGAWCEMRNDFRNFRVDRISNAQLLDERFLAESGKLMAQWLALPKHRPDVTTFEPKQEVSHAAAK